MITYPQAGELLALAAARDQRTVGDADVLAWAEDLNAAGITYDDASAAIRAFYQEMATREPRDRFRATPVDLISIARRQRRERLANFRYEPPPADTETPREYLARLRGQIAAVADGRREPAALRPALPVGDADVAPVLELVGRPVPDEIRPASPMSVQCPACGARIGQHCRSGRSKPRIVPHGARKRAADGAPPEDPAEIERRRAASIAYLADHQPEESA